MKSANAVTIDNLGIKEHLRWAQDQEVLDSVYVTEASVVAPHPEILGMSLIYPSRFEELFDLQKKNQHWASFSPPKNFHLFGRRFFSYRLFPSIHWEEAADGEAEEESPGQDLIKAVLEIDRGNQNESLFEKDRATMLGMLESIKWINELLKQIHGRKLQYQKG